MSSTSNARLYWCWPVIACEICYDSGSWKMDRQWWQGKTHVALCCIWSRLCMIIVVVVLLLLLLILLLAVAKAQPSMTHSYITGKPHFQFQQRVTSYASYHHPCSVTLPVQPLNHFELALHRCTMRHLASKPAMPPNQFEVVLHRHTKSLLLYWLLSLCCTTILFPSMHYATVWKPMEPDWLFLCVIRNSRGSLV